MTTLITLMLGVSLLILVLFFALFLPALDIIVKMKSREKVKAIVKDVKLKYLNDPDYVVKMSKAKYEFEYEGKTYEIEDNTYSMSNKIDYGDEIYIYIEKGNPDNYLDPAKVRDRYLKLVISILGMAPLIVFLIVLSLM